MNYEKPEALEIGRAEEVVLGNPKRVGDVDAAELPRDADIFVAEVE
jgi:hypothetical protein